MHAAPENLFNLKQIERSSWSHLYVDPYDNYANSYLCQSLLIQS